MAWSTNLFSGRSSNLWDSSLLRVTTRGGALMSPHPHLSPPSHMALSPGLCRSSSASLQFFSEDIVPCAAGMRCVPGAGGSAWVQDLSMPPSWTAISLLSKLGWLCFATRTRMYISISIIYPFLLWVDIHGFSKVITYYYAFLSDYWKAFLQLYLTMQWL